MGANAMRTPHTVARVAPPRAFRVEIAVAEKRALDALRIAPSRCTRPEHIPEAQNLRRDIISRRRMFPLRHLYTILRDAYERGAEEADVLALARTMDAEIKGWFQAKRGIAPVDFNEAHIIETDADTEEDKAQARFFADPSPMNAQRYLDADADYMSKREWLLTFARQTVAESYSVPMVMS